VYAEAIDALLERGVLAAPAHDAGAVILFFEGGEGLMV
jgi:hypothetical protein